MQGARLGPGWALGRPRPWQPIAMGRILRGMIKVPVVLRPGEDGWIVAECPIVPGCVSQGRTREEAIANIREAIQVSLESQQEEGWSLPVGYEVIELPLGEAH